MTGRLRAQPLFLLAALPALAAAQVLESADAALAADRFPPMRLARLAFDKFGVGAAATQGTPTLIVDTASSGLLQACTAAPGDCSLRGALARAQDAALAPGDDTIGFAIPAASDPGCVAATGVCTINLTSAVTVAMTSVAQGGLSIDGYTQSGASANTQPAPAGSDAQLKIEITGSALTFQAPITLRGIAFGAPFSISCLATPNPRRSVKLSRNRWWCARSARAARRSPAPASIRRRRCPAPTAWPAPPPPRSAPAAATPLLPALAR